jgi:non-ribosomal peptide synthetase-like protein
VTIAAPPAPPAALRQPPIAGEPTDLYWFFERSAHRWPNATAIEIPPAPGRPERRKLSYARLRQRANTVAVAVDRAIGGAGGIAAVLLPRTSGELFAAQLGVLRSGSAYVCVDTAFPDEQLRHILQDSDAQVLLTDGPGEQRAERIGYAGIIIRLDAPLGDPGEPRFRPAAPDDIAYLIYTSGTTGTPKGVMIPHRGICNLVASDMLEFGLGWGDRVAQGSSSAYDSSVEEVWMALSTGATVVVLDDETARLGPDLIDWLRREHITVLCPPPTLLRATGCDDPQGELPDLRLLYVGGEALTPDVAERWAPGRRMVNGYGPTECTVTCLRQDIIPGEPIGIGRPVPGAGALVLDESLHAVPPGEPGELCMSGAGLALGYRHQPELTAQKFVWHPRFGRIYRTGDLVHADPDGTLIYHGRIDSQVKLRGYRIELEAIEACLARCPGVREAACRVEGEGAAQVLVAHVVPADPVRPPESAALRAELERALPVYMVPAFIAPIGELPRSAGGKVRRTALPPLAGARPAATNEGSTLRDPVQAKIEQALRRVLPAAGTPGPDDDFFATLGGSSLQAAMLISELRTDPALATLTVRDVYEARTIAGLAAKVGRADPGARGGAGAKAGTLANAGPAASAAARQARARRPAVPVAGATAAQVSLLLAEFLTGSTLAYLALVWGLPWLAGRVSLAALPVVLLLIGAAARPLTTPVLIGFAVLAKRVLIGRYRPIQVPVWSDLYVRMWIVRSLVRLVPWNSIAGTEFQNSALRALGARIGERVHIHTGVDLTYGGWDLLYIEDDVTINQDAHIRLVDLADGQVVVGPVRLAAGCTLEVRAGVGPNTVVGRGSVLSALSSLPSGGRIGDGVLANGVPAVPVGPAPAAPHPHRQAWSPRAHAVATLLARSLLTAVLGLPFLLTAILAIAWADVDFATVLDALSHPLHYLVPLAVLGVMSCVSLVITVALEALACRALGPIRPCVISVWSLRYIRVTLKTSLVNSAGNWLSGGLFWPVWLRWAGMSIGRGCEISTIIDVVPDLVKIGSDTFFADGIYLGGPRLRHGAATLGELRVGRNTFLGNHAVLPPGQRLPRDILVGVCTVADARTIEVGTSWFGHPAFELPRREVVTVDRTLTHTPPLSRVISRLFWEWLRFALPIVPLTVALGWTCAIETIAASDPGPMVLLGAAAISLAAAAALCGFVLALKWVLLGKVEPGIHPLWSCWCSRWDFLYVAWGFIAGGVLSTLEGTLLLPIYLRRMGMRIGKRVVLGDGFAQVVDPDMLDIGDGATVHAMFQAHTFEDRVLKIDHVRVGAYSTLGDATVPLYGADIGDGAHVAAHSVIMKREHLLPGLHYEGVPTAERA